MNYDELIAKVYIETARPDLVDETKSAVIASTQKMHGLDFFFRDLVDANVRFGTPLYIQALDVSALDRYRSFAYIRKWDASFNASQVNPRLPSPIATRGGVNLALAEFKLITPDDILDSYGSEKTEVAYAVGNSLIMKSATAFNCVKMCWYQYPLAVDDNTLFSSWIADQYPYTIIFDAASSILQKIGMQDAARKYDAPPDPRSGYTGGLVWSQINNLKMANVIAKGS